jgi:hypothetical protein
MIELFDDETIEEADQQGATKAKNSIEFRERSADRVWLITLTMRSSLGKLRIGAR